jgi:hypothetical protein
MRTLLCYGLSSDSAAPAVVADWAATEMLILEDASFVSLAFTPEEIYMEK